MARTTRDRASVDRRAPNWGDCESALRREDGQIGTIPLSPVNAPSLLGIDVVHM